MRRTEAGWRVEHIGFKGDCDSEGKPTLYASFEHDNIKWPADVPYMLRTLWEEAAGGTVSPNDLQARLNEVARRVNALNVPKKRSSPKGRVAGRSFARARSLANRRRR